jgi:hypothetical protein
MCESSLEAHQINDAIDCADVVEQRWSVASYNNSAQHKHGSHGGNVGPPHGCTTAARVLRQGPDSRALTYSAGPSPTFKMNEEKKRVLAAAACKGTALLGDKPFWESQWVQF